MISKNIEKLLLVILTIGLSAKSVNAEEVKIVVKQESLGQKVKNTVTGHPYIATTLVTASVAILSTLGVQKYILNSFSVKPSDKDVEQLFNEKYKNLKPLIDKTEEYEKILAEIEKTEVKDGDKKKDNPTLIEKIEAYSEICKADQDLKELNKKKHDEKKQLLEHIKWFKDTYVDDIGKNDLDALIKATILFWANDQVYLDFIQQKRFKELEKEEDINEIKEFEEDETENEGIEIKK